MIVASLLVGLLIAMPPISSIDAPGPDGPLRGTLTGETAQGQPVVLIIPGSGPTNRDGNNPLGVKAATYRLLADGLAQEGIATVRIDKRGMFDSAGAIPDANAVTLADYVIDTKAWIEAIRQRTSAKCVWLLGHSEGGLVALASGQLDHVCGLILVSAVGRPLGVVMKEQLHANPANAPLLDAADHAIDALTAGQHVDVSNMPPPLVPLFRPPVQNFLISLFAADPAALIRKTDRPVLILQGERDIQVSVVDARLLKAADPKASLVLLPDTNHVLKQVTTDDREANVATYSALNLPLAPGVVDAIATFIKTAR
jgi:pimeloyl-ACP methyl ester carboxylesterase